MKYIKSLDKVAGMFFSENNFLVSNKDEVRLYDFNGILFWKKILSGNLRKCSIYNKTAYIAFADKVSGFEKTTTLKLLDGMPVNTGFSDFVIISISNEGNAIAYKYNSDYSINIFLIQIPHEHIVWEKRMNNLPLFVDGNRLISGIKNSISFFNDDGNLKWTYDTSELGTGLDYAGREQAIEVRQIMGVWEEVLWINLNNGSFLLLDVNTGIFQKHLRFEDTGFNGNLYQAFIDRNNEIIYGLFLDQLSLFDMKSFTTEVIDLSEEFKKEKIESRRDVLKLGDQLLFGDDYNNKIASLNLSNKKLDWVYNLAHLGEDSNERPRGPRKLELKGDKLFVLDNKNTLHIFEKE